MTNTTNTGIPITGKPIVYSPVSYEVFDGVGPTGSFQETMLPGVANDPSGKRDALLLVNHSTVAPPLARESSGTLQLQDTPSALCFNADLDPTSTLARDLLSSISRKDLTAMSVGFRVLDDEWSDDYMQRTVRSIELLEISACNMPASPTTSISLDETAAKKKKLFPEGGPDGPQGASYPYGGLMGGDGSGSRDKSRWSSAERRAGARAGGIEQRGNLAGTFEVRRFDILVPRAEVHVEEKPVEKKNHALQLERDLLRLHRRGLQ